MRIAGILYRDQLGAKYAASDLPQLAAGAKWLSVEDVNRDSWLDLVTSAGTLLNRHGTFEHAAQPVSGGAITLNKPPATGHWIGVKLSGVKNLGAVLRRAGGSEIRSDVSKESL